MINFRWRCSGSRRGTLQRLQPEPYTSIFLGQLVSRARAFRHCAQVVLAMLASWMPAGNASLPTAVNDGVGIHGMSFHALQTRELVVAERIPTGN